MNPFETVHLSYRVSFIFTMGKKIAKNALSWELTQKKAPPQGRRPNLRPLYFDFCRSPMVIAYYTMNA